MTEGRRSSDDGLGVLPASAVPSDVLEGLIDGATDGLALLSADGRILRANEAVGTLLGVQRDTLVGRCVVTDDVGVGVDGAWILESVTRPDAVTRTVDLPGGRKGIVTLRAWRGDNDQPRYLTMAVRDGTSIHRRLLGRVDSAPLGGTTARWWQMRRGEVGIDRIVLESSAMRTVAERALQFAQVDSPVLIMGETGTGKTCFSRIIHQASSRAGAPLREVNCGAIPAELMESELFGYVRGAFTGAEAKGKTGLVELADGGTLLLDEIGDLPLPTQVKLLQFLEAGEVWPVGAAKPRSVDVRVIAATNADLADMVERGAFRRDLFYRLNVLGVHVPPLREHPEDIPALIDMMSRRLESRMGKRLTLAAEALELLARYPFPGNIRELWNVVERLAVLCRGDVVEASDLPPDITRAAVTRGIPDGRTNLRQMLRNVEAGIVREALERYGSQTKAAQHLGVGQATIARKARLLDGAPVRRSSISG